MLILARKIGERIVIVTPAGPVWVVVVKVKPNGAVRLGIDAPKQIPVHREETWRAIQAPGGVDRKAL